MWCSSAYTRLKQLDRAVSGAIFLTGVCLGVIMSIVYLSQYYAYCIRSGETLCTIVKVRFPLRVMVPLRITRGALFSHRYTYAPNRCRTSQYRRTFITFSRSLWNDLDDHVLDGVGLEGFKSRANAFLLAYALDPFLSSAVFSISSFCLSVGVV